MKFRNFITKECTQIILGAIRVKGRLTIISDESSINRSFLNEERFKELHFYQLVRQLAATSDCLTREKFAKLGEELFGTIYDIYQEEEEVVKEEDKI